MNLRERTIYIKEAPFDLEEEATLVSRFHSHSSVYDDYWIIEVPLDAKTGKRFSPPTSVSVRVIFYDDQKIKNYFDTTLERIHNNPLCLRLRKVKDNQIIRVQRRKYFRLKDNLDVLLLQFNKHNMSERTQTIDISGGGLSFQVTSQFDARVGDTITGFLFLNPENNIVFRSKIIRILANGDKTKNIAVEFTEIAELERQKIIEYCFLKR